MTLSITTLNPFCYNSISAYHFDHPQKPEETGRFSNRVFTNLTPMVSATYNDKESSMRRWCLLDDSQYFTTETVDLIREYLGDKVTMRKPGAPATRTVDTRALPTPVRVHFIAASIFGFQPQPIVENLFEEEAEYPGQQTMRSAFRSNTACLICQEGLNGLTKKTTLVFCKSCNNFSHKSCMFVWLTTINEYNESMWRACPQRCRQGEPVTTDTAALVLKKNNSLKIAQGPFPAIPRAL